MSENGRLRWRSRRGMLELDIVLHKFIDERYSSLDAQDKLAFEALLAYPDNELWDIISGKSEPEEHYNRIIALIGRG